VEIQQDAEMILEQAHLDVIPDREAAFDAAFSQAKLIISAMPGFRSLRLSRRIEQPSRYLLLVEWDRLEDHTEGFGGPRNMRPGVRFSITSTTRSRWSSITRTSRT
jgi:hypothetical protein